MCGCFRICSGRSGPERFWRVCVGEKPREQRQSAHCGSYAGYVKNPVHCVMSCTCGHYIACLLFLYFREKSVPKFCSSQHPRILWHFCSIQFPVTVSTSQATHCAILLFPPVATRPIRKHLLGTCSQLFRLVKFQLAKFKTKRSFLVHILFLLI